MASPENQKEVSPPLKHVTKHRNPLLIYATPMDEV